MASAEPLTAWEQAYPTLAAGLGLAAACGSNVGRSLQRGRPGRRPAAVGKRVGGVALHQVAAGCSAAATPPARPGHSLGVAASAAAWLRRPELCAEVILSGPAMQVWRRPRATIAPTPCVLEHA